MRCYNQPHRFYRGVDLYARSLYAHVLDAKGQTVLDKDLPAARPMRPDDRVQTNRADAASRQSPPTRGGLDSSGVRLPEPFTRWCRARRFASPARRHGEVSEASPLTATVRCSNGTAGPTS
jgi:hypothetical protein